MCKFFTKVNKFKRICTVYIFCLAINIIFALVLSEEERDSSNNRDEMKTVSGVFLPLKEKFFIFRKRPKWPTIWPWPFFFFFKQPIKNAIDPWQMEGKELFSVNDRSFDEKAIASCVTASQRKFSGQCGKLGLLRILGIERTHYTQPQNTSPLLEKKNSMQISQKKMYV